MDMRTPLQHPYIAEAKKHRVLVGLAALLIVIAGGWYWYSRSAQNSGRERLHPVAVTHGTIEDVVTAQGKLEPNQYVDVGTQVSGQLKKIYVQIGDTVKQGQLVAEIDPRVYQSQVEATEAHIGSLKAQPEPYRSQCRQPAGAARNAIAGGRRGCAGAGAFGADQGKRIQSQRDS